MFANADPTRFICEPSAFAPCVAQIKQLAALMIELYSNMTGSPNGTTRDVDGTVYYGKGYEDSDLRIPSMRLVKEQVEKASRMRPHHVIRCSLAWSYPDPLCCAHSWGGNPKQRCGTQWRRR